MPPTATARTSILAVPEPRTYEAKLQQNVGWALEEGSRFFQKHGAVHETLRNITQRLNDLGVPYAVCGGMALVAHGYDRFTQDVDILVTAENLKRIHQALSGRGFLPPFEGSKHLRDTETKVRVEFLVTGQFPGDGKPKPVAFPDPSADVIEVDGVRYLGLKTLVELKLASGISAVHREKDLVDVQELITVLNLPRDFANQLSPYVADHFRNRWDRVHGHARRFIRLLRDSRFATAANTMDDLIALVPELADSLEAMKQDGIVLDIAASRPECVVLSTTDPAIAAKYEMEDERDVWKPGERDAPTDRELRS